MSGVILNEMANIPGVFGKIPSLGDFITRRLHSSFVDNWDQWLQNALMISKEQLGSQWLDTYLTSPIWQFCLSPGICDANCWAGIMMPSVDRVGRYFPLTLAVALYSDRQPGWQFDNIFTRAADWFEQMEQLALATLQEDIDSAELDQRLQTLPFPAPESGADQIRINQSSVEGHFTFHAALHHPGSIDSAFSRLGIHLLAATYPTYSLWWTKDPDPMKSALRVYSDLPPANVFHELLIYPETPYGETSQEAQATIPDTIEPDTFKPDTFEYDPQPAIQASADTMIAPLVQWSSFAATTVGKRRTINEDAFLDRPEIGLWVVADGMGGHGNGDKASQAIIDTFAALVATGNIESFTAYATECLRAVNTQLIEMADQLNSDVVGATVVILLAVGERCAAIWAGDSRLYQLRQGVLTQLTKDHSLAAEIAAQNPFGAVAVADNIVTCAVGAEPEIQFDVITFDADADDHYLLCSDGLVKEVSDSEIESIMTAKESRDSGRHLIELALERGARDNVTVVTVFAGSPVVT